MSFKRSERIAGVIRKEIADILLKEISDPRIGDITITDVMLSGDLRQATVFFVQMGKDRDSGDVHDHLQKASGLLKRELGRRLHLRYIPEIRLIYDGSFEYGSRIDRILETVKKEKGHET
ncbi:MAG TPA: 30S ribosome-binding factor RbfA [Syntrophales bacterium]|nr:30S ribosome-binding factor RbfA [Syntrophobacterales bacterium]HRR40469.1 30S ribosome-binding factor RbfA [Syntrophales bacterium]HRT70876.1 30S ribosome-binding factor RbfA [Syntrophales bacterium]